MSEAGSEVGRQMARAVREACRNRREWSMPAVIVRFTDGPAPGDGESGPFTAAPQAELSSKNWPGAGRAYEVAAELDRDELDDLADYDDADLDQYVSEVMVW